MPHSFRFNHDAVLSPQGLLIADSYKNVPLEVSSGIPGYVYSGNYIRYANWPPLHFVTLNIWHNIFGNSLFASRLLSILITSITIPIFFILLLKITNEKKLAFIGSVVFLFFPFRLLYGSLIFCDIWIPFFWCSALLLKVVIDEKSQNSSGLKKFLNSILLGLYLGIGTLYSWQTFFMLPAIMIYDIFKHKKIKKYSLITFAAGSALVMVWIAWILITSNSSGSNSAVSQFFNRSILGFIYSPAFWFDLLVRRVLKLIIDGIPLLFLFLILSVGKRNVVKLAPSLSYLQKEKIKEITWISMLSIVLYLLVMPGMFAPHEFQFILFHLGFTILFVFYLTNYKWESKVLIYSLALYVTLCLITYTIVIPKVHDDNKLLSDKILCISGIADSNKKEARNKPILVINSNSLADSLKGKTLTLTYLFNSFTCIMDKSYLLPDSIKLKEIENTVDMFSKRMPSYLLLKIDKSRIFVISDLPLSELNSNDQVRITKTLRVTDTYVYSIDR